MLPKFESGLRTPLSAEQLSTRVHEIWGRKIENVRHMARLTNLNVGCDSAEVYPDSELAIRADLRCLLKRDRGVCRVSDPSQHCPWENS